ncbi:hypothetical protein [Photobacterium sp. 53610]|uniref:hypothetical protein n=1 Tax=Photobacterium sp. 53610 TaxID=3102789 RepID=UPI002ED92D2A
MLSFVLMFVSGSVMAFEISLQSSKEGFEPYCAIQVKHHDQRILEQWWGHGCGSKTSDFVYRDSESLLKVIVTSDRGNQGIVYYIDTSGAIKVVAEASFQKLHVPPFTEVTETKVRKPFEMDRTKIRSSADIVLLSEIFGLPLSLNQFSPSQLYDEAGYSLIDRIGHKFYTGCSASECYFYICDIGRQRVASVCFDNNATQLTYNFAKSGQRELSLKQTYPVQSEAELSFQRGNYEYALDTQTHQLRVKHHRQTLFEAQCR